MKMYPYSFNVTFMKSKPLQDGTAACFTLLSWKLQRICLISIQLFKKKSIIFIPSP